MPFFFVVFFLIDFGVRGQLRAGFMIVRRSFTFVCSKTSEQWPWKTARKLECNGDSDLKRFEPTQGHAGNFLDKKCFPKVTGNGFIQHLGKKKFD